MLGRARTGRRKNTARTATPYALRYAPTGTTHQPTTSYTQSTSRYPLPTIRYPPPTTHSPLTATHDSLPATRNPGPTTRYPLSATRYTLPTTRYPLPTPHHPLPTIHCPLPKIQDPVHATNYQLPATRYPLNLLTSARTKADATAAKTRRMKINTPVSQSLPAATLFVANRMVFISCPWLVSKPVRSTTQGHPLSGGGGRPAKGEAPCPPCSPPASLLVPSPAPSPTPPSSSACCSTCEHPTRGTLCGKPKQKHGNKTKGRKQ